MEGKGISMRGRLAWPLGLGALWFAFLVVLAVWSARSEQSHVASMAEREARAFFQQVVVTRSWNAAHGGVYVRATENNPPNKYLKDEDKTVETVGGLTLTKINPAYMTRQISTIASDDHDVRFHITSLDPIRPENMADVWEAEALREFNRGRAEKFQMVATRTGQFFRYMAPLKAKESCMRCHAEYGHAKKSILGGISVTFDAAPLIETRKASVAQTHLAFTLIFLVGFVGICGSTYLIQKKREEAERANRTKSVFLANMSHDMRTPLNGIMGMTELMLKKGMNTEQSRYADMVRHSAWSLLEIITDITDFSRLESGRLTLTEKPFDVRAMLDDALNVFHFETANKSISLESEVAPSVPRFLKGDAFRLKQIIANLVGNAVKFTQQGAVTVAIDLEAPEPDADEQERVRLRVSVTDTGIGIPEEEQETIFESFRQVDDSYAKKHEGSGLGLAICKQLVTMMGGDITVKSAPDKGTTFRFHVSLLPADRAEPATQPTEEAAPIPSVPPRKILVVEDNPLNQMFAMEILEAAGHPVTLAENGHEALEALRNAEFDLVFMDVQMPEMDGIEATRRIRSGEAGEHARTVPIIAATAFAVEADREQCLQAGMDDCVIKPLESRDLIAAVAAHTGMTPHSDGSELHVNHSTETTNVGTINVNEALERLGGRRELFEKLGATFLADTPTKMAALSMAVERHDTEETLRLSHGLKNSAGMIQATRMAEAALALELAVREDRLAEIPELFATLKGVSDASLAELTRLLEA